MLSPQTFPGFKFLYSLYGQIIAKRILQIKLSSFLLILTLSSSLSGCPAIPPSVNGPQITLEDLEVTQSIQDIGHSVRLIADKTTVVRAYFSVQSRNPVTITGRLNVTRPDGSTHEPISPINNTVVKIDSTQNHQLRHKRDDLVRSLNFLLPPDLVGSGTITVAIHDVNEVPSGKDEQLTCSNCKSRSRSITFFQSPILRLRLVNMLFSETRTKDGKQTVFNYPGPRPIDLKLIASWIGRAYPLAADPNHLVIDTIAHNVSLPLQNGHILTNNPSEQVTCLDINSLVDQQRKLDIQSENDPANFTHYFGLVYDGGDASKYFVEGCSPILDRNDPAYKSKLFTYIGTAPTGPKGPDAVPWRDGLIDSRWDKDGSYGDWYTGHELGHLLGRYHPDKYDADERVCERPEGAIGDGFPFEKGQLSNPGDPYYVGFDSGDLNPVSQVQGVSLHPKVMPGEKWHDIMTYCVRQWASSAAYESIRLRLEDERNAIPVELHGALKTGTLANGPASRTSLQPVTFVTETRPRRDSLVTLAASEVPSTNFIAIGATLNLTQITGKIDYISQVPTGKLPSASEGSLARIRLKDKDGKTIHEYAITVAMLSQRHTKDHIGVVSETIPYSEQIATLELVLSDKVIDVRRVSNHPPQVLRIDLPRIDERRFLTEPIVFKWVAKDDDQEALTYSVQLTLDEGRTWRTIAVRLPQPELSVRSDQFGNAPTAMIRVIANDGFLSATLTSAPLLLPNRVQPGGTIVGKVTFSGRPERKEFSFAKFPNSRFCQKNPHKELINGDRRFMPTIELAKDGGLKNAVVAMVDVEDLAFVDGYQGTEVLAEFCDFLPLIGVVVSSKNIHVENRDADSDDPQSSQGVLHNIHSYTVKGATSATDFNIRLAKKGDMLDKPVTFRGGSERVGYYRLQCDQHEFMQSFFLPVSNPHFTVVKDDGTFEITNVPVGMHKLVAWHPFAGRVEVEVDVPEGGTTNVKLAIKR